MLPPVLFVDSKSHCKDLRFPNGPNLAQKPLFLEGTVLNCSGFLPNQECHAICTLYPNNSLSSSKRQTNTQRHAIFVSFPSWALQLAAPCLRFLPGVMPLWRKACCKRSSVQLVCSKGWLNELADEESKGFHRRVIELWNRIFHIWASFSLCNIGLWCTWEVWRAV